MSYKGNHMPNSPWIGLLCLLIVIPTALAQCSPNAPVGICDGPQDRSEANVVALGTTNGGCPIDKVSYYHDDDETQPKCGECTPGKGGWEDPSGCNLDEYCNDAGKCAPLSKSPFYKKPCPYETGFVPSFCGAGLRCYHHVCLPCLNGMMDYSDGKLCVGNQWTYSRWAALAYNPSDTFALLIFLFLVLAVLVPLLYKLWRDYLEPKWRKFRNKNISLVKPSSKASQLSDETNSDTGSDTGSDEDCDKKRRS